jgi:hypothetical protein
MIQQVTLSPKRSSHKKKDIGSARRQSPRRVARRRQGPVLRGRIDESRSAVRLRLCDSTPRSDPARALVYYSAQGLPVRAKSSASDGAGAVSRWRCSYCRRCRVQRSGGPRRCRRTSTSPTHSQSTTTVVLCEALGVFLDEKARC